MTSGTGELAGLGQKGARLGIIENLFLIKDVSPFNIQSTISIMAHRIADFAD